MFVIMVIISTFTMYFEDAPIGIFLGGILFGALVLGFFALIALLSLQIFNITQGEKDENWSAEIVRFNSFILSIGVFYFAILFSSIIYQITHQTFLETITAPWKNGFFFFNCSDLLLLLFLNKRIRENYRWTLMICVLVLLGVCFGLYYALDASQEFGAVS